MARLRILLAWFLVFGSMLIGLLNSDKDSGEWSCNSYSEARVPVEYRAGVVTLYGHDGDWKDVDGFEFSLLPALDPHAGHEYKSGKMTVKALHDGKDMYFMLQVDGDYEYSKGSKDRDVFLWKCSSNPFFSNNNNCPSVALMFQVGESATYHNMGGCKESPDSCTSKSCHGYEVDIVHFSIGNAVPGRLYGGNPIANRHTNGSDRFGHLVDLYSWNPHCWNLDGISLSGNDSSAQNDWKGAWWHNSFTKHSGFVEEDSPYASSGQKGTYYFEFSRPLRTMDRLQQDVQFTIGQSSKFSVAFWYPVDGNPWHGSGHYTISCEWVPLDISPGSSVPMKMASGNSWDAASAFALLLSVVVFCIYFCRILGF